MKILRSQYLQLQSNAENQQTFSNKITKTIQNKGKDHAKGKQELGLTAAPTRLLRKKDIVCFNPKSAAPASPTNIKILIENPNETLQNLNVVLEYVNMSPLWLTNVYKTYENDLWHKKCYLNIRGDKKWNFCCSLCDNIYKTFVSLKSHLNLHLNVYPYVCKMCLKEYTNRKAAINHLKKFHKIEKQQWNDFLTS